MNGQLLRVMTSDRIELQGFLVSPESGVGSTAILHMHGLAGNFYENRFVDQVARAASSQGFSFLTTNNRGHDYISDLIHEKQDGRIEYRQIGGVYEAFEDCILDIRAWVEFLKSMGTETVILQGHSHGALKVTYYLYRVADPCVSGLILLSPSDDFGMQRLRLEDRFGEALELADRLIARGEGARLMPEGYFHYPISARTYSDIFQEGSRLKMFNLAGTDADTFPELESIKVPVLVILGSVDEEFVGAPGQYLSDLRAHMKNATDFAGFVVDGAPHNYLKYERDVAERIKGWLRARSAT